MTTRRQLPDGGSSGIFTRMARVGGLTEAFQQRCLAPFDLRFIDFSLLRVLQLGGEPHEMTPSELAGHIVRSTAGVTQIVDRLARRGLVARQPDAGDRRRVLVALTPTGDSVATAAHIAYAAERARLLGQVDPNDLETADRVLGRLLELLGAEAERFQASDA